MQYAHQSKRLRESQVQNRHLLHPRAELPVIWAGDELHVVTGDPELRMGPRGVQSSLSYAALSQHSWIHVLQGRVEFILFSPSYRPALYEEENGTFALNAFTPDFAAFPTAIMAYPWRVTVEAGDTLFIPAETPVQWRVTDDVISLVSHFVDWSNAETVAFDIERLSHCGNRAMGELAKGFNLHFLNSAGCQLAEHPADTPFRAFLTWRNEAVPS
eukprot:Sspe_Gene.105852::Locus_82969_Transcript_1_1_Confidence_1.000_Length_652::g.105852::m.105852